MTRVEVAVTKRYRETLDEIELEQEPDPGARRPSARRAPRPSAFRWRGRRYEVLQVLGHWREDPGWWHPRSADDDGDPRSDGEVIRIRQTDLWRVEASRNGRAAEARGVYELVHRAGEWRLDRVWD